MGAFVMSQFHDPAWRQERARIARRCLTDTEYRAERKAGALERKIADALPMLNKAQRERLAGLLRDGAA
jgi:hypothetical protein